MFVGFFFKNVTLGVSFKQHFANKIYLCVFSVCYEKERR